MKLIAMFWLLFNGYCLKHKEHISYVSEKHDYRCASCYRIKKKKKDARIRRRWDRQHAREAKYKKILGWL